MLTTIGRKKQLSGLVPLLLECHERIRFFTESIGRLAAAHEAPPEELRKAAIHIRRYFTEALPKHVADEETSILPRLRGCDHAIDEALAQMEAQHEIHAPLLERLVADLTQVERGPEQSSDARARLGELAQALRREFDQHLELEESVVFPAIARFLDEAACGDILAELRNRREPKPPLRA